MDLMYESAVTPCCNPLLLQDKSASDDHERSILTRLKQQCGAQFTSKMEGMVTDLQLAREKQNNFDEWKRNKNKQLPIDLSVTVLTTGMLLAVGGGGSIGGSSLLGPLAAGSLAWPVGPAAASRQSWRTLLQINRQIHSVGWLRAVA